MSLDTLYADSIEQNLQSWAANPGPEPQQSFSVTSFLGAGLKGLPSAALEVGGSVSDLLSGFGAPLAASGVSAGGMFSLPSKEEQKQEAQAREQMLNGSFDTTGGNIARRQASVFSPDPLTAHAADQVMHGLVRFGAKAVGAVGTMGPAGALVLGAEEANTVTQNLRAEGVDTVTAAKVGGVQGAIAGASAVFPLGGRTLAQTIGLVGIGGPGGYMAQEHFSRRILEEAGYLDQASLHNPFDPLGLSLSTVVPGAFGAMHLRGEAVRGKAVEGGTMPLAGMRPEELRSLRYDDPRLDAYASTTAERYGVPPAILLAIKNAGEKSGSTATSPKGAVGVMQFMPGTAKEMGLADRTDPVASIDAGARYLQKLYAAYGSWDAVVAHYNGGGAQAAIVRGGGQPTAKETIGYLRRVQDYVAQHSAGEAAKDPANVDAARVAALQDTVQRSLPDTPDAMAQVQRAADVVAESGGREAERAIPDFHVVERDGTPVDVVPGTMFTADEHARIESLDAEHTALLPTAGGLAERGAIRQAREELETTKQQIPDTSPEATRELAKDIQGQQGVSYKAALSQAKKQLDDRLQDVLARVDRLNAAIETNATAQKAVQRIGEIEAELAALQKVGDRRSVQSKPQEAPPARAADNALPEPHEVKVEGDEPAKPEPTAAAAPQPAAVAEAKPAPAAETAPPRDAAAIARDLELLQKRHSTLQTLLECLEAG